MPTPRRFKTKRKVWMAVGSISIIIAIGLKLSSFSGWYIAAAIGLLAFSIYKYSDAFSGPQWQQQARQQRLKLNQWRERDGRY